MSNKKIIAPKNNLVLNQWVDDLAAQMATEAFKVIKLCPKPKGSPDAVTRMLAVRFMVHYIELLMTHAMTVGDKEEAGYRFSDVKVKIQQAIAEGFERALIPLTNKVVEYWCSITLIGEPVNKKPC
jgi:hypothetical protein